MILSAPSSFGFAAALLLIVSAGLSGCVSSTLDSAQLRPVGANKPEVATIAPDKDAILDNNGANSSEEVEIQSSTRGLEPTNLTNIQKGSSKISQMSNPAGQQSNISAVSAIRAKASAPSGPKTHIGALPDTASPQLTAEDQSRLKGELADRLQSADLSFSDAELAEKQRTIRLLQKKAKSHYEEVVHAIEK